MSIFRSVTAAAAQLQPLESRHLFAAPSADTPFGFTDSTFGTAGHATAATFNTDINQLVVAANGSIYEIGDQSIARFSAAGKLDKNFGTNGLATVLGGSFVAAAVDSSNRLYSLVRSVDGNGTRTTVLVRYTAAGQADGTYATGGSTTVLTDENFNVVGMDIQSDGKIVIAGRETTNNGNGGAMRVLRVGTDGSLDSTFGNGGSFQANLGTATSLAPVVFDETLGVKVLSDGNILVGGGTLAYAPTNFGTSSAYTESDFALARLTSAGALDTSFGSGGIARQTYLTQAQVKANVGDTTQVGNQLPTQFNARADGSAVFVGHIDKSTVAKLNASGGLVYRSTVPVDPIATGNTLGIAQLSDGRSVLFAYSANSQTGFALTPVAADGAIGATVLTDDLNSATTDITGGLGGAIGVASNGQILVGGISSDYDNFVVQQLNASTATAPRPNIFANASTNKVVGSSNGYLYLAYHDTAKDDLVFVRRLRNGFWSKPITLDAKAGAGTYLTLGVDSKYNPFVAYYDRRSKTLKLASSADLGLHFSVSVLDQSADVGQYVDSVSYTNSTADPSTLVYYDKTNGDLKYATQASTGKWTISTLDAKGDVGQDCVITSSSFAHIQIAYADRSNGTVKFAGQDSNGKFQFKTVGTASKGVESMSILSTITESPAVLYHDLASGDLRLSVYTTGPKFVAHTIATRTGQSAALTYARDGGDPVVYTYSKSSNRLLEIVDPLHTRVDTVRATGGSNFSVDSVFISQATVISSFVDPTSGILEVRTLPFE